MRKDPQKISVNIALLLAAGASTRMGEPKQLLAWRGTTFLEHTLLCLKEGGFSRIVLVLGAHLELFLQRLPGLKGFLERPAPLCALKAEAANLRPNGGEGAGGAELLAVVNSNWAEGMASSLGKGLEAALNWCAERDERLAAVGVCPVDLPLLNGEAVHAVLQKLAESADPENTIIAPECGGRRGHPVIFGRAFFEELGRLQGDRGGSALLKAHKERVIAVSIPDAGIAEDCDSKEEYRRICLSGSVRE